MSNTHTLDADGHCLERCPHDDHDAPVVVVVPTALEQPLRTFLDDLDIDLAHFPTAPDEAGGMRSYVAVVRAGTYAARTFGRG